MSGYRKLGKTSDQRRAMLRAMTTYLLENGQIKTTVSRAKEVAPMAEKMITLAKKANLANYRQALSYLTKEDVAKKLFDEIGPKYADRNGGYTPCGPHWAPPGRRGRDGHRSAGVRSVPRALALWMEQAGSGAAGPRLFTPWDAGETSGRRTHREWLAFTGGVWYTATQSIIRRR